MNTKFTSGPWLRTGSFVYALTDNPRPLCGSTKMNAFSCAVQRDNYVISVAEAVDIASLIAAAPDHAAIAMAMCAGVARWEAFASGGGEFCIGGLRHATKLDDFGVPVMTDGMRAAIAAATGDNS